MKKNPFFFILKKILKSEINSIFKMSKSIVANKNIAVIKNKERRLNN